MYGLYNWIDKVKRYAGFRSAEMRWIIVSIIILGIIVGFDDGRESFNLAFWLPNLFLSMAVVGMAVLVHEMAHRIIALEQGFRVEFKPFFYGLVAGLLIAVMSFGKLMFVAYSGVHMEMLEKHRLGYFRYGLGYFMLGKISAAGPLANFFVAFFFKFVPIFPMAIADKIVLVNALFAIFNMLPIPPLDGANILFAGRPVYFPMLGSIIGASLLLLIPGIHILIVLGGGLAVAFFTSLAFFGIVEKAL